MKKILLNLALFQVGWLVCVLGGNTYAIAYTLAALALHHWLVMEHPVEWKLIAGVVLAGCLWDVSMARGGVSTYADGGFIGIPLWLICLWFLFATTLMHCLLWLSRYPALAVVLAAVFGPATYWAGASLTDAVLTAPLAASLGVMALGWGILFPCGLYFAKKLNHEYASRKESRAAALRGAAA